VVRKYPAACNVYTSCTSGTRLKARDKKTPHSGGVS
jgi:hypothetical protein